MAAPAVPRTWLPGDIPTATHLNTDIKDPINFFKRPPAAIAKHNANVTVTSESWTLCAWADTDAADTDTIHNPASSNSRLVATTAGFYQCFAHVRWNAITDNIGVRQLQVRKNAAGAIGSGTMVALDIRHANNLSLDYSGCTVTGFVSLAAADYIEAFVWHDHTNGIGTPTDLLLLHADTTASARFGMMWIASN